jgi:hypothetical protein
MARLLRRLLVLAILAAAVAAAVRALRSQRGDADVGASTSAPSWPPLSAANGAKPAAAPEPAPPAADSPPAVAWVEPTGGACPDGYTVKATQSGLFHLPGGQFYDRSVPVRCYADAAAAEADGYRAAKR